MEIPGTEKNIREIASILVERKRQGRPFTLFLGARTGGLFGNAEFYHIVQQFSLLNLDYLTDGEKFQECYKVLSSKRMDQHNRFDESNIYEILAQALRSLYYREEDEALAELAKAGFFDAILTTNIDSLLEDTDTFWDGSQPDTYQLFVYGVQSQAEMQPDLQQNCRIIKIFGDLKLLNYYTVGQEFELAKDQEFAHFLTRQLSGDVLIVGYDTFWDHPLDAAFPESGGMLWYLNEDALAQQTRLARAMQQRQGHYLIGVQGSYRYFCQSLHDLLKDDLHREAYMLSLPPPSSQAPDPQQHRVFLSYSHEDRLHLDGLISYLQAHLGAEQIYEPHTRNEQVPIEEIKEALKETKVAILVVSADFLASEFIREEELPRLLDAAQIGRIILLPIILSPCAWSYTRLSHYQVVNSLSEPLMGMAPYEQEIVWAKLAQQTQYLLGSPQ